MSISKEKNDAVQKLLLEADKKFGKGSAQFGNHKIESFPILASTGSLNLDVAIGIMGIPKGRIMEAYGAESSGKTTIALHMIREVQKAGGVCAFIDAEHALDRFWAIKLGVNVEDLIISQPNSGEEGLALAEMYVDSGVIDFIVVDSVSALTPRVEIEGEIGDSHIGLQARLMGQALRKITPKCGAKGSTILFLNQIRYKIGVLFGSPETTSGGNALKFFASVRMRVSNDGSISDKDDTIGQKSKEIKVKFDKNKLAPPFMVARCKLNTNEEDHNYGIDKYEELVDIAVAKGIMNKAGTWYSYNEERLGQGKKNIAIYFKNNIKIYEEIYNKVIENIQETQKDLINSFASNMEKLSEKTSEEKPKRTSVKKEEIENKDDKEKSE